MDYAIDRRLWLQASPEHKSLYSWAIVELDDKGQQLGHDQIPWGWRLAFTATEVVLSDHLTVKEEGDIEGRLPQIEDVSHRRGIRAELRPGDPRDHRDWFRRTTFRMFGTDRVIEKFTLDILPLASDDDKEEATAWGTVTYSSKDDYPSYSQDDCVCFYLQLKPSTFEHFAARIAEGTADELTFSVSLVQGFYSEWSPDISTRDVKVLTAGEAQQVEMPDGVTFDPPRLHRVGEAELHVSAKRAQSRHPGDPESGNDDEPDTTALLRPEAAAPAPVDATTVKVLKSLQGSARWIIGLLVVLTITVFLKR